MEFVTHRWVANDVAAEKARLIWSKIIEVVSYWQQLPKNKQPGRGKPGANTSYTPFMQGCAILSCSSQTSIFQGSCQKLNEFQVVFQTDKAMAPFFIETLEDLIKTLTRKFTHKDLCDKSCSEMAKLDFNDVNNQKPTHLVDLGFTVNHEIQLLKSSRKITKVKY